MIMHTTIIISFIVAMTAYGSAFIMRPQLMFQPSLFIGSLVLVFLGSGAAFWYPEIGIDDSDSFFLRISVVLLPMLLLIWGFLIGGVAGFAYSLQGNASNQQLETTKIILILCIMASIMGLGMLLSVVPIDQTGIYAIFFIPQEAARLREETFKLLPSGIEKSLYTITKSVIVPIGMAAAVYIMSTSREIAWKLVAAASGALFIVVASINGARSPMVMLLALAFLVYLFVNWHKGMLTKIAIAAIVLLVVMVAATIIKSKGAELLLFDINQIIHASGVAVRRVLASPFETGLWHYAYVAEHGLWPLTVIGFPMKGILGIEHINHFQEVGGWYAEINESSILTTNLNTSFIFNQQVIFGLFTGFITAMMLAFFSELIPFMVRILPAEVRAWVYPMMLWVLISAVSTSLIELYFKIVLIFIVLAIVSLFVASASKSTVWQTIKKIRKQ